jgi:hypothetical protein
LRLADFIENNTSEIIEEWETFAQTLIPADKEKTPLVLRDHIVQILAFIVRDMKSAQTNAEQIQKSHGKKEKDSAQSAAETHAVLRLAGGFNIARWCLNTAPYVPASLTYGTGRIRKWKSSISSI